MNKTTLKRFDEVSVLGLREIKKELCGKKLGSGLHRDVYELKDSDKFVIKIEIKMNTGTFANIREFTNYNDWGYTGLKDWLAKPCLISQNGKLLIQERLFPTATKNYPKKIPYQLTDLKKTNFGVDAKGKFKCCDFGLFLYPPMGGKFKVAKWWGKNNYVAPK